MVAWVLFFPGSMWTGWATHDAFVDDVWTTFHLSTFSPSSLVLKYGDLGRSPALLHALPGAVWCALIPMQLRGFDGDAHRARGRVALAAAAVMMVGFALIDVSGLEADSYDFGGNGGGIASAADSLGVLRWAMANEHFVLCIRGNHEDGALYCRAQLEAGEQLFDAFGAVGGAATMEQLGDVSIRSRRVHSKVVLHISIFQCFIHINL